MPYLIGVRRTHKDNWTLLGYLPAAPGVHLAKEELHQNGKGPEEGIVGKFVHGRNGLLALCLVHHVCGAAFSAVWLEGSSYVCGGRDTWVTIVG